MSNIIKGLLNEGAYHEGFSDGMNGHYNNRASSIYGPSTQEYQRGYRDGEKKAEEQKAERIKQYQDSIAPYLDIPTEELKQRMEAAIARTHEIRAVYDKLRGSDYSFDPVRHTPPNHEELRRENIRLQNEIQLIHQVISQRRREGVDEAKESDYGPEYQEKVKRLGQMAKQGERKTVWDPVKRVYKTVPVNTPKEQGVTEGWVDTIKNIFKRKPRDNRTVFEKDPEAMREFERSGGYEAGLDPMGWQIGWFAAENAQGDTMKQAFQKLYYGGGSPVPFDDRSFKLAWVAYNKHHGPQVAMEGPAFDKWADERVASQLHKLKPGMVRDRKTGKWYDPNKEFEKKMNSPEVMAQMKRMAQKEDVAEAAPPSWAQGMTGGIKPPSGGATTQPPGIRPPPPPESDNWMAPHGDAQNEYKMFRAGQKPAVIVRGEMTRYYQPLLNTGEYPFKRMTSQGRSDALVVGQPTEEDRVKKIYMLVQTASDRAEDGDFSAYNNSNYHRTLGRLLGYPEDKINAFINHYFRDKEDLAQTIYEEKCPECGGPMFSDLMLAEKKDACYHKVRSRYKVWPSAYASGALVQCRKKGASNWGNKSESIQEGTELYGLQVGDTVRTEINGKEVQGDIIDIFPESMEVELLLRGPYGGKTVTVDVRDTEALDESVAEGLPQTLRKVVPGYTKREIDRKMDAGKFGKTDADKDANFQRYKKIQDKLKEQGVAEGSEQSDLQAYYHHGPDAARVAKSAHKQAKKLGSEFGVYVPNKYADPNFKNLHIVTNLKDVPEYYSKQGVAEEQLDEKCWDTHKQVGMKKKGGKMVPNCVPKESAIMKGIQQ